MRAAPSVFLGERVAVDAQAATAAGPRGVWLDRVRGVPVEGVERITTLIELTL